MRPQKGLPKALSLPNCFAGKRSATVLRWRCWGEMTTRWGKRRESRCFKARLLLVFPEFATEDPPGSTLNHDRSGCSGFDPGFATAGLTTFFLVLFWEGVCLSNSCLPHSANSKFFVSPPFCNFLMPYLCSDLLSPRTLSYFNVVTKDHSEGYGEWQIRRESCDSDEASETRRLAKVQNRWRANKYVSISCLLHPFFYRDLISVRFY